MPQWWAEPVQDGSRFYRGRSMAGTFRPGDRLSLEPVAVDDVRPGDVVVFVSNRGEERDELVHRIVAATPEGLVARGDNNPCPDSTLVTAGNLLGRVTHVERAGQTCSVPGGQRGLLRARLQRIRVVLWRGVKAVGRRPYRELRSSGLVARWWQPPVRRVRIVMEKGLVVKYVCEGRTVANWWPEQNRFECQKPYDLVIPRPDGA
jgi:signal peptidase I